MQPTFNQNSIRTRAKLSDSGQSGATTVVLRRRPYSGRQQCRKNAVLLSRGAKCLRTIQPPERGALLRVEVAARRGARASRATASSFNRPGPMWSVEHVDTPGKPRGHLWWRWYLCINASACAYQRRVGGCGWCLVNLVLWSRLFLHFPSGYADIDIGFGRLRHLWKRTHACTVN